MMFTSKKNILPAIICAILTTLTLFLLYCCDDIQVSLCFTLQAFIAHFAVCVILFVAIMILYIIFLPSYRSRHFYAYMLMCGIFAFIILSIVYVKAGEHNNGVLKDLFAPFITYVGVCVSLLTLNKTVEKDINIATANSLFEQIEKFKNEVINVKAFLDITRPSGNKADISQDERKELAKYICYFDISLHKNNFIEHIIKDRYVDYRLAFEQFIKDNPPQIEYKEIWDKGMRFYAWAKAYITVEHARLDSIRKGTVINNKNEDYYFYEAYIDYIYTICFENTVEDGKDDFVQIKAIVEECNDIRAKKIIERIGQKTTPNS